VIQRFAIMCFMLLAVSFLPVEAQAQILDIDIDSGLVCTGGVSSSDNLFDGRNGDPALCDPYARDASGAIITYTDADGNVRKKPAGMFRRFFCIIETTLGLVLSTAFCAIRDAWLAPFGAMMMLLMAFTGICFATGIIRFTVKEVSVLIFKMGLVALFVTNAGVAINLAYALYIGIMKATVQLMMAGFDDLATNVGGAASGLADTVGLAGAGNPFNSTDTLLGDLSELWHTARDKALDPENLCSPANFIMVLVLFFPLATFFVLSVLLFYLAFFARAAYGYLYALVMVTFLIAAMPIFVSFALFKTTEDLFKHWLSYLGSNVIQIFVIFGIMGFAVLVDIGNFIEELSLIIKPHTGTISIPGLMTFEDIPGCSICEPNFTTDPNGAGTAYDAAVDNGRPYLNTAAPCLGPPFVATVDWPDLIHHNAFFRFIAINSVVFLVLTMVMEQFMKMGPDIARALGGANLVHTLTGQSQMGRPSLSQSSLMEGRAVGFQQSTQKFEAGFSQRWRTDSMRDDLSLIERTSIGRAFRATGGGFAAVTHGEYQVAGSNDYEKDRAYAQERRDIDRAREQANTQVRRSVEAYSDAKKHKNDMETLYKKGEVTKEQLDVADKDWKKKRKEMGKAKRIREDLPKDVARESQTDAPWRGEQSRSRAQKKSFFKMTIEDALENKGKSGD